MLDDPSHLPASFLVEDLKEASNNIVFGTLEGEGFTKYKVGNEVNEDPHLML